jgi:MtN3 and saliva related transmembrane protein
VALWAVYGVLIGSWPVIIANVLTLLFVGAIVVMKLRFG